MKNYFSLGLLTPFAPPAWMAAEDRLNGGDWWTGKHFVSVAQRLEAAGLDYLFLLDTLSVRRTADGSMADSLKHGITAPSHDPLALLPMLAAATEKIGLIGTASTTFYPPYMLARLFSTLDSMSGGRIGWNVVTSFEQAEAQNYGASGLPPHDERYNRAEEYLDVAHKLWNAWGKGSLIADQETNTYVDAAKVREINHSGPYFSVRGPLNVLRSPQVSPLIAQAGASERGRDFAAKNAELTFVATDDGSFARMRAIRDDLRARAIGFGRHPDDLKVVYPANVAFLARPLNPGEEFPASELQVEAATLWLSQCLDLDLTQFPLDKPFPLTVEPSGIRSMFDGLLETSRQGKTLRQSIIGTRYSTGETSFFGTPEQVADKMIRFIDEVGGDGIMLNGSYEFTADYLDNITERLVPALKKAGAIRPGYADGATFRERLFAAPGSR